MVQSRSDKELANEGPHVTASTAPRATLSCSVVTPKTLHCDKWMVSSFYFRLDPVVRSRRRNSKLQARRKSPARTGASGTVAKRDDDQRRGAVTGTGERAW